MIKIENTMVTGWEAAIRGARNPMNSWDKSDSWFSNGDGDIYWDINHNSGPLPDGCYGETLRIGPNDLKLLSNLAKAGSDEAKFRRMIVVYVDLTAPMYWWKEADTYKVGTVRNSCSTMHKIHAKEFTLDDFSTKHLYSDELETLEELIQVLNGARELYLDGKRKEDWWQMIQLLPSSYNQRATLMLNYEVLANMYHARKFHKLDEWREFCTWIETLPYAEELIVGEETVKDTEKQLKDRIRYLETQLAKELYSKGLSIEDISNWLEMSDTTVRKIVEENKS